MGGVERAVESRSLRASGGEGRERLNDFFWGEGVLLGWETST